MRSACDSTSTTLGHTAPADAVRLMLERLSAVDTETVPLADAVGRILAAPLSADRDNPPCDVSAMDGYAVRLADLRSERIPVRAEALIGSPPVALPPGEAMRVFTGAPVPLGAEAILPREQTEEYPEHFTLRVRSEDVRLGDHIRKRGENIRQGRVVLEPGCVIDSARTAALAAFGSAAVCVRRRLRVGILPTGNELRQPGDRVADWQIHDSNGPALRAALTRFAWLEAALDLPVQDEPEALRNALLRMLERCDVILLTGGVSKGDHDHVRATVQSSGATVIFHGLPIRPGKPLLGAIGPGGQAILGLPGNPQAVLVTARRFAQPVLKHRAGEGNQDGPDQFVRIAAPDKKTLSLYWYRLVREAGAHEVELVPNCGSGDIPAAARSNGFVEVPPDTAGCGPFPFYRWL